MPRKLSEKQKIAKHNKEVEEYQMKTQGFTGYVYPVKKKGSTSSDKSENKKDFRSFKDLVERAREKGALVELILPEGETM